MTTQLYVTMQTLLLQLMDRERSDERGQGTLEYVGMVAVAVIMVAAVLAVMKDVNVGKFFMDQVRKVIPA